MTNSNIESKVPTYEQLMWPTLKALKALGGSASNEEILDKIIELEAYADEVQSYTPVGKTTTMLDYRCAWARSYLKKIEAINNSARGVWVVLEKGEKLKLEDMKDIPAIVSKMAQEERKRKNEEEKIKAQKKKEKKLTQVLQVEELSEEEIEEEEYQDWYDELLSHVMNITPDAFERLCQRVLRESDFSRVEVTGKVGDGGIDGKGILRVNLISFHVYFQSKRWRGSVGSGEIRNFRGAISGRADKGLFITTGTFTADARKEAVRDGAMTIDLIDGRDLCDILKRLKLGVQVETIEKVVVQPDWFKDI